MWSLLLALAAGPNPRRSVEAEQAEAKARVEALSVEVRGLLATRGVCVGTAHVAEAEALAAGAGARTLVALETEQVRLLAACGERRPCAEAVEDLLTLGPDDPSAWAALRHARTTCTPETVPGLWLEALALEHAGLQEEAGRFRDDAVELARAVAPSLLPLLDRGGPAEGARPPIARPARSGVPWTCLDGASDPACEPLRACVDAVLAARRLSIDADLDLPRKELDHALADAAKARERATLAAVRTCVPPALPADQAPAGSVLGGVAAADLADAYDRSPTPPYLTGDQAEVYTMALGDRAYTQRDQAVRAFRAAAPLLPDAGLEEAALELQAEGALAQQEAHQAAQRRNLDAWGTPYPPARRGPTLVDLRAAIERLRRALDARTGCLDVGTIDEARTVLEQAEAVLAEKATDMLSDIVPITEDLAVQIEALCPVP